MIGTSSRTSDFSGGESSAAGISLFRARASRSGCQLDQSLLSVRRDTVLILSETGDKTHKAEGEIKIECTFLRA